MSQPKSLAEAYKASEQLSAWFDRAEHLAFLLVPPVKARKVGRFWGFRTKVCPNCGAKIIRETHHRMPPPPFRHLEFLTIEQCVNTCGWQRGSIS